MKTSDFDYELPPERIAQEPAAVRGTERMLVLDRAGGSFVHRHIADIVDYLNPGDLLVVNDTRVFPARLKGVWRDTGGAVEVLLLEPRPFPSGASLDAAVSAMPEQACWRCLAGSGRPARPGQVASFGNGALLAEVTERFGEGVCEFVLAGNEPLMDVLEKIGLTPVPPYIHRDGNDPEQARLDKERYQTIYAREVGAVAAPTAGLHFTEEIFAALEAKGVRRASVTLHVGPGTFKPVKTQTVEEHVMDAERYSVPNKTEREIADCKARGGRVIAVGSTSVRTLETVAAEHDGRVVACSGSSRIFIYPPYTFRVVDAMLTNFHLPQSTLIMMVSALAGRERILAAYKEAVERQYMFFSYGDCMLIL
ncbi:MAG: tRNA preQ1(34) S-adenosylmethionine ribosyltransferase-isomerase QueA [Kiritimatiellae bacterium]|nr:tRNA preQ1(34) S-adenosylmethionine ribosyltransferase-isomerase QueA [Kiritimatiellia bacterium]